jgi:hypothetical protein
MIGRFLGTVRRNHALEHATVSLLIAKLGPDLRLVGRATGDGFFIYGDLPTDVLTDCVHEGLQRLKRGEAFWAVTPLCGTNLATAGILAGLSSFLTIGSGDRKDRLPNVIMAGILAVIAAQPLGRIVQRHVTTSPDLVDTEILGIDVTRNGSVHKVRTRRSPRPVAFAV